MVQNKQGKDTSGMSLSIGYKENGDFRKRDLYRFENAHSISLKVSDVTINGADTASLTNVILLKSSILSERYHVMKNNSVSGLHHTYFNKDNEIEFRWKDMEGAVQYDLEWTWVDNYDYSQGTMR
ncbi:MAG: hypothetical protein U5L09_15085 [Bacteroidales bacterium]|nr:hypothetical protein [Bacteroidales bacterium]